MSKEKLEELEEGLIHTHTDKNGNVYAHAHVILEEDSLSEELKKHPHTHSNTKAVLNRLSRLIGHLEAIKRMVEDGRDCSEVLIQLSAVRSAINNTSKVILEDHISHCLVDAVESGDHQVLEDLYKAIGYVIK